MHVQTHTLGGLHWRLLCSVLRTLVWRPGKHRARPASRVGRQERAWTFPSEAPSPAPAHKPAVPAAPAAQVIRAAMRATPLDALLDAVAAQGPPMLILWGEEVRVSTKESQLWTTYPLLISALPSCLALAQAVSKAPAAG